ncbi:unnamed protein product, partial [marine sediment metagenome]
MYESKEIKKHLDPLIWIECKSIIDVRTNVIEIKKILNNLNYNNIEFNKIITDISLLCCYIRDHKNGMGKKNITRWMILEFKKIHKDFDVMMIPMFQLFGCWKDLNLLLLDINNNKDHEYLETKIYEYLVDNFKKDLDNFKEKKYNNISLLVKYIGKERRSLDKRLNFTRKFVSIMYP